MSGRFYVIFLGGLFALAGIGLGLYLMESRATAPASDQPAPPPVSAPAEPEPAETPAPPPAPPPDRPAEPEAAPTVEAPPMTGTLRIESDVPGTVVFIDRVNMGTAPVVRTDVPPGQHTVVLSPEGYEYISRVVNVVAGEDVTVSGDFTTIRLDEAIAVVHKHTFGSCRGTLRASPSGLTYETDDEDDRFTAGFADIETFEMDYLNVNLRVKIRNGKTYNFTDPDGDADTLFVFHRDVDRVRQRATGGGL